MSEIIASNVIGQSVTFFVRANACKGEAYGEAASYGYFKMNQSRIDRLNKLKVYMAAEGLETIQIAVDDILWSNEDELNYKRPRMIVNGPIFWFEDEPKNCNYSVETVGMPIADLQGLFDAAVAKKMPVILAHGGDVEQLKLDMEDELEYFNLLLQNGDDEGDRWYVSYMAKSKEHAEQMALDFSQSIQIISVFQEIEVDGVMFEGNGVGGFEGVTRTEIPLSPSDSGVDVLKHESLEALLAAAIEFDLVLM